MLILAMRLPKTLKNALINTISNLYNSKTVHLLEDNGICKKIIVESDAFAGGAGQVTINPIVKLVPISTYPELIQVEYSKFNLRVDDRGRCGLIVADTGYFEKEVQRLIKQFLLEAELPKEIREKSSIGIIGGAEQMGD